MAEYHFAHPQYLYALLVVLPSIGVLWWLSLSFRRSFRQKYGEERLVSRYTRALSPLAEALHLAAWLAFATLTVFALAGPIVPDTPQKALSGSLQVVVVLDVSKSMGAEDYRNVMPAEDGTDGSLVVGPHGSRLEMAKYIIRSRIMGALPGNQIGIVTYTGSGFPQADLSDDFQALRFIMSNWIKIGSAPGGGSDFAEGLQEALETFKRDQDPSQEKVIVLFSDGGFTGDQAKLNAVSQEIVAQNIRLIVIGLGMPAPSPIPLYKNGQLTGYLEKDGQIVTTALQEATLVTTTQAASGEYIHLTSDSGFEVQWVNKLAGSKVEEREAHVFHYPLAAACAILVLLYLRGLLPRRDTLE